MAEEESVFNALKDFIHVASAIKEQVASRWETFQKMRTFKTFEPGKSDEALSEEHEELDAIRKSMWERGEYQLAQNLFDHDLFRSPDCVAFAYNNTVPTYNASTMFLLDRPFIACEGPRSKDVSKFFEMIQKLGVTHLVRLTDSYEGEKNKCHPYWDGLLKDYTDRRGFLEIPTDKGNYSLKAYDMAFWRDMQGVEPEPLLSLVHVVREEMKDPNALVLIHCSAGVGRTGTFLATLAIVDAIDRNEPFSIEEIVYRLSLQRVQSVSRASQYITLFRTAEHYLKEKNFL